jgi:hypothetical protein
MTPAGSFYTHAADILCLVSEELRHLHDQPASPLCFALDIISARFIHLRDIRSYQGSFKFCASVTYGRGLAGNRQAQADGSSLCLSIS